MQSSKLAAVFFSRVLLVVAEEVPSDTQTLKTGTRRAPVNPVTPPAWQRNNKTHTQPKAQHMRPSYRTFNIHVHTLSVLLACAYLRC